MLRESISVKRLPLQRAKNHHLQRAGEKVSALAVFHGEFSLGFDSASVSLGLEQNSMRLRIRSQEEKEVPLAAPRRTFNALRLRYLDFSLPFTTTDCTMLSF